MNSTAIIKPSVIRPLTAASAPASWNAGVAACNYANCMRPLVEPEDTVFFRIINPAVDPLIDGMLYYLLDTAGRVLIRQLFTDRRLADHVIIRQMQPADGPRAFPMARKDIRQIGFIVGKYNPAAGGFIPLNEPLLGQVVFPLLSAQRRSA